MRSRATVATVSGRPRQAIVRSAGVLLLALALGGCAGASAGRATTASAGRATASSAGRATASSAGRATATNTNRATASNRATTTSAGAGVSGPIPQGRPQVIEPTAGVQAQAKAVAQNDPVGDVNAHAPSLAQVRYELRLEVIAARVTSATYIDPLRYVTVWGRTDQGVDASMPVGAPILAPCTVKVLAIIPDWYTGQPLVYFELLEGPDAGKVQYVAEQITDIAPAGSILQQGQAIARYAPSGTAIEYGWSTLNGVTLARATTGYEEGEITPAGQTMRAWLNSLGANAGNG